MDAIKVIAALFAAVLGIFLFVTLQNSNRYTEWLDLRTQMLIAAVVTIGCMALTLAGAAGEPARRQLQGAMGLDAIVRPSY